MFVVLLLPGYTFVRRRQHDLPSRERSALDEVASVIFAGFAIDALVIAGFLGMRALVPALPPNLDQFIVAPHTYFTHHYAGLAATTGVLLLFAIAVAWLGSGSAARSLASRISGGTPDGHQSSWWLLFNEQHPRTSKYVSCVLDDGALVRGTLFSFSRIVREHADREIVLMPPLYYRPSADDPGSDLPGVGAVSVSSKRIQLLMVSYVAGTGDAGTEPAAVSAKGTP